MYRIALALLSAVSAAPALADAPFAVRVVDAATGRGVPLVELETTNAVTYVTDSAGYVALTEPALFGQKVFFNIRSHGYEASKDGFGYRGQAVDVTPGGEATIEIKRLNVAERLYRVTGADLYRDSVLLGKSIPIERPLLNARVVGSDSVVNAVYRGKLCWFWGDTSRPAYPLGLFDVPGAVSDLPTNGGLDPNAGVNLTYFEGADGFARATAKMPGEGPTWIDALTVLTDDAGRERMFAAYVKIQPPLTAYARGLAEWNDDESRFEKVADLPLDAPVLPSGHPFKHVDGGAEYVYFASPYPLIRVRATPASFLDLAAYEAFTCLVEGSRFDEKNPEAAKLDRGTDGTLRYSWKRRTPPLRPAGQKALIDAGLMKPEEGLLALRDRDSGKPVTAHGGSVYWNDYRKRWIMIFVEQYGSPSFLGEVWYAEADRPAGPWAYATKIATHERYDFYNPKQHPMFDADGGRTIYFEGTYTNTFSGNPVKTPRYDYNQVMYRLDLADERLATPVAIYRNDAPGAPALSSRPADGSRDDIAFFALDRSVSGSIPIYWDTASSGTGSSAGRTGGFSLTTQPNRDSEVNSAFHAFPADSNGVPATTVPLYEFTSATGERQYATEDDPPAGFERGDRPVCRVWPNPLRHTVFEGPRISRAAPNIQSSLE